MSVLTQWKKKIIAFGDVIRGSTGSAFSIGKFLLYFLLVIRLEACFAFIACVVGLACVSVEVRKVGSASLVYKDSLSSYINGSYLKIKWKILINCFSKLCRLINLFAHSTTETFPLRLFHFSDNYQ